MPVGIEQLEPTLGANELDRVADAYLLDPATSGAPNLVQHDVDVELSDLRAQGPDRVATLHAPSLIIEEEFDVLRRARLHVLKAGSRQSQANQARRQPLSGDDDPPMRFAICADVWHAGHCRRNGASCIAEAGAYGLGETQRRVALRSRLCRSSVPVRSLRGRAPHRRDENARRAVLRAADDLLVANGFGKVTIEGIAARAGVSKQTIYRP